MKKNIILGILLSISAAFFIYKRFFPTELDLSNVQIEFNENQYNLADIQTDITVVAFFQTWCIDCIKEIPTLMNLNKQVNSKRLTIILVTDESLEKVEQFKSRFPQFILPIFRSKKSLSSFGVSRYPTTVMLDKSGKILLKTVEGKDWDNPERINLVKGFLK
jgi:thiol-disulfide isomerase/thioredoxin